MIQYVLEIELKSETVFGSGHSVPGMVDQEVLYDDYSDKSTIPIFSETA